jgi:hypothetical protein
MSISLNVLRPRPSPSPSAFGWFYFSAFGPRSNQISQLELAQNRLGSYLTRVLRRVKFFYRLDFLLSRFRFTFRSAESVFLQLVFYSTRINTNAPILGKRRLRWGQISNSQRRFISTIRHRRIIKLLERALPYRRFSTRKVLKTLRNWFFYPRLRFKVPKKAKQTPKGARKRKPLVRRRTMASIRLRRLFFIVPFAGLDRPVFNSMAKFTKLFPIPVILPLLAYPRRKIRPRSISILGRLAFPKLLEFLVPFRFQRLLHRRSRELNKTTSWSRFDPVLPIVSFFSKKPTPKNLKLFKTRLVDPNTFFLLFGVFYARLFRRQPLVFKLLALRGRNAVLKGLRRFRVRFSSIFPALRQMDFCYHYEYGMESLNSRLLLEYVYVRLRLRYRFSQVVSRRFLYRLNSYFYGVYFLAKGRFERRQRAMYRRYFIGTFSPNTQLYNLDVSFRPIVTKHGRGGLRLALNSPRPPIQLAIQ